MKSTKSNVKATSNAGLLSEKKRKRHIDGNGDNTELDPELDPELDLTPALLTRRNLALFDEMAKKKAPASSKYSSTISTTSDGFDMRAGLNGIVLDGSPPPSNLEEIWNIMTGPRDTPSPTQSEYEFYLERAARALNEQGVVAEAPSRLFKQYKGMFYRPAYNYEFTAFPSEVGFNDGLSAPKPDFVEGLAMEAFLPFPVHELISGAVLSKHGLDSITLAHIAGEFKAPGKDLREAKMQGAYDGAALVYARHQALSYLGVSDPPGYAAIITFTLDGDDITFYAHYATTSGDGTRKYHQYRIKRGNLVDSRRAFTSCRTELMNLQDHAMKQSCALRDGLKKHWEQRDDSS